MEQTQIKNHFLSSLSAPDFELLRFHLHPTRLQHGFVLFDLGEPIEHVLFPETGIISLVVPLRSGDAIEAGVIGRDGVIGGPAVLDGHEAVNRATVQVPGNALQIRTREAREAVNASNSLRSSFYRYDQLVLAQAQQAAACNAKHQIEERLCRWLLRTHDLTSDDDMPLTQEFISHMLGVRRTSVSLVASQLQSAGIISYSRGHIRVLDKERIKDCACECYEDLKIQERRILSDVQPDDMSRRATVAR